MIGRHLVEICTNVSCCLTGGERIFEHVLDNQDAFRATLERLKDLPIAFWDERLSTVAAERTLIEMDFSRKRRETKIDSAALSQSIHSKPSGAKSSSWKQGSVSCSRFMIR